MNPADLAFDRDHLWHPYSSASRPATAYPVRSASGVRLRLERDGREVEVIDAMSSWWAAIHGYAVPELDAAVRTQLESMSHVMFGGLTHQPAVDLGRELLESWLPAYQHVFFADSGSVAVEVAMKMALQARPGRTRFFTIRGGYHGDTFNPMSVCDPEGGMHATWAGLLPEHVFAPRPPRWGEDLDAWKDATTACFEQHAGELAAVIVEPVLQGAGGMHGYDPACNDLLIDLARAHGVLVMHDEIATGFWRTGVPFAADRIRGTADIVCIGKALTGGYLTLGATLCTAEVAQAVSDSAAGGLMHGPTFMANPLACSVALASLRLLRSYDLYGVLGSIEDALSWRLVEARGLDSVRDVRVLGAVGVIELDQPVDVAAVTNAALDRGVWVRPFRNLVYTMPPYVSTIDEVEQVADALVGAVKEVHG